MGASFAAVRLGARVAAVGLGVPVGYQAQRVVQRLGHIPQVSDNLAGPRRPVAVEKHGYSLYSDNLETCNVLAGAGGSRTHHGLRRQPAIRV